MAKWVGVLLGASLLAGQAQAQAQSADAPEWHYRRAAWVLAPMNAPETSTVDVKFGEPFFRQRMVSAESVRITKDTTIQVHGMRFTKQSTSLAFEQGEVYHRVMTAEPGTKIYCGAGVGFTSTKAMFGGESRRCLADDSADGIFDRLMLGTIYVASNAQPMFGMIGALMASSIKDKDEAFMAMILEDNRKQVVNIPYSRSNVTWRQFDIGAVIVRNRNEYAVGLSNFHEAGKNSYFPSFEPSVDGVVSEKMLSLKGAKFRDLKKINLASLPVEVDIAGLRFRVISVSATGLRVERIQSVDERVNVLVGYFGILPNRAVE